MGHPIEKYTLFSVAIDHVLGVIHLIREVSNFDLERTGEVVAGREFDIILHGASDTVIEFLKITLVFL